MKAHDFDGRRYEKASAHQKEWGTKLIAELDLRGSERILDLGCGDGEISAQIAERLPGGSVVGIDASPGMIRTAVAKTGTNLQFLLMDINEIRFVDQFDVVLSNATLHWVKDHRSLLRNVYRALRTGGCFRVNFAGEGNCSNFFNVIRKTMARREFADCFASFEWPWYMPSVDEYEALVESNWPSHARVWGENADRFFPDVEAMISWIDQPSIVPFLACVPEEDKRAFRDVVVSRMIEETQQVDGRCFETFRRINVYGVKSG